jgi:hypothetical protein
MARITIHAKKLGIAFGAIHHIYIDNEKMGQAKNGETIQVDVSPGNHILQIRSNWYTLNYSPKINFSINDAEEINYLAEFTPFFSIFSIVALLCCIAILIINRDFLFLTFIFLFIITYFSREKNVRLREKNRIAISSNP